MPGALRKTDTLTGTTTGEHGGHYTTDDDGNTFPVHSSGTISGQVSSGSSNVLINGLSAARQGDSTQETDNCDSGTGSVGSGSSTVLINGQPAARISDTLNPHNGSGSFTSSSGNVIIGG